MNTQNIIQETTYLSITNLITSRLLSKQYTSVLHYSILIKSQRIYNHFMELRLENATINCPFTAELSNSVYLIFDTASEAYIYRSCIEKSCIKLYDNYWKYNEKYEIRFHNNTSELAFEFSFNNQNYNYYETKNIYLS